MAPICGFWRILEGNSPNAPSKLPNLFGRSCPIGSGGAIILPTDPAAETVPLGTGHKAGVHGHSNQQGERSPASPPSGGTDRRAYRHPKAESRHAHAERPGAGAAAEDPSQHGEPCLRRPGPADM